MDNHGIYTEWVAAQKRILDAADRGVGVRLSAVEVQSAAADIIVWEIHADRKPKEAPCA
jgi:hypothetical protein